MPQRTEIARWETTRGAHYCSLYRRDHDYERMTSWINAGYFDAANDAEAIALVQAMVDKMLFTPSSVKKPMRRVR